MTDTISRLRRSIGIVPGRLVTNSNSDNDNSDTVTVSIKSSRDFIKVALAEGTQILPCYSFGGGQVFGGVGMLGLWVRGRMGLPIPCRRPILTVVGRPIQCPQTDPAMMTPELVHEFHQIYLSEVRRIFDTYKNMYGWRDKKLAIVQ